MNNSNHKAFTLVELIVVIVILSILATIAFLSFGSQSSSARDSTRLSDVAQLSKWLSVNATTTSTYALPDKSTKIMSGSTLLWYQWEAWTTVKNVLRATSETFIDPLDKTNYTYVTNAVRNKHQLLAFLENKWSISFDFGVWVIWDWTEALTSYTSRYPYTKWDALWVILSVSWTTYTPIQEISTIQTSTWFDITNTTVNTWMTAFVSNTVTSTWVNVSWLSGFSSNINPASITSTWPKWTSATDAWASCKDLLTNWVTSSWTYWIKPDTNPAIMVYCDMSTDWGWWTVIFKSSNPALWKTNTWIPWTWDWSHDFRTININISEVYIKNPVWDIKKSFINISQLYWCKSANPTWNINWWDWTLTVSYTYAYCLWVMEPIHAELAAPWNKYVIDDWWLSTSQCSWENIFEPRFYWFWHIWWVDTYQWYWWNSWDLWPTKFEIAIR